MKLSFDDAVAAINGGRFVRYTDVQARALNRRVWVADWHTPGCLSESFSVCLTKADAVNCAVLMVGDVRGAKSDLRKYGRTDRVAPDAYVSTAVTTVSRVTLASLF